MRFYTRSVKCFLDEYMGWGKLPWFFFFFFGGGGGGGWSSRGPCFVHTTGCKFVSLCLLLCSADSCWHDVWKWCWSCCTWPTVATPCTVSGALSRPHVCGWCWPSSCGCVGVDTSSGSSCTGWVKCMFIQARLIASERSFVGNNTTVWNYFMLSPKCVVLSLFPPISNNNNNNRIQRHYSRFFTTVWNVRSSGPGAIVCKSRATHRALVTCKCHVTCHLVWRDSSAIKFDRVEIAFIWALFYWLNQ